MNDYTTPLSTKFAKAKYVSVQNVHFAVFGGNTKRKKQELLTELDEFITARGRIAAVLIHDALYYRDALEKIREGESSIQKNSQAWFEYIGCVNALEGTLRHFRETREKQKVD